MVKFDGFYLDFHISGTVNAIKSARRGSTALQSLEPFIDFYFKDFWDRISFAMEREELLHEGL